MPGLVNVHTHVPMNLLRGLGDDLRLDVWLLGYIMPVEREFVSPEFVHLGTSLACAELIRSGVTSFADMYYFEDQVAEAAAEAGLRAICCQTILKFPSPDADSYEEALAVYGKDDQKMEGSPPDHSCGCPPCCLYIHGGYSALGHGFGPKIRCSSSHSYR